MNQGEQINFDYTGSVQTFIVPVSGIYALECWGAQGGTYSTSYIGGKGGYSKGTILLKKNDVLYVYVGGQPAKNSSSTSGASAPGGFNGGGTAYTYRYSSSYYTIAQGGGGATDIRIGTDDLYARAIVAGGGGGSTHRYTSSSYYGGGETSGGYDSKYQATQTSAGLNGSFGQGGNATGSKTTRYGPGGGGGGWYGGGCGTASTSTTNCKYVGGGSGYVLTETSYKPTGYLLTDKHWMTDAILYNGNTSIPAKTGTGTQTGNEGNGFARITFIEKKGLEMKCNINQSLKEVDTMFVKVNGTWKEVDEIFTKSNGNWI